MRSPAEVAAKWARGLAGASATITAGVNAVTESPTAKAARQADAYIAGIQRSVASGKWQRGLGRVSAQDWKDSMIKKGIPRISSGASAAQPKFESFMGELLQYIDTVKSQLASMPRGDIETNKARAMFVIDQMSKFRRRG